MNKIIRPNFITHIINFGDVPTVNIDYVGMVKFDNKIICTDKSILLYKIPYYVVVIKGIKYKMKFNGHSVCTNKVEHPSYTKDKMKANGCGDIWRVESYEKIEKKLCSKVFLKGEVEELDLKIILINKFRDNLLKKINDSLMSIKGVGNHE